MMNEIKSVSQNSLNNLETENSLLLVLDENSINNNTIKQILKAVEQSRLRKVFLAIPEDQYQQGLRGWAKIKILSTLIPYSCGVITFLPEGLGELLKLKWGSVCELAKILNKTGGSIIETHDQFDLAMIDRTSQIKNRSNCWYVPAGCVIVNNGQIVCEATSTNFDKENFNQIPLSSEELKLNSGERLNFGESMHAEPLAIALAAKDGKAVSGATLYVNKFPCINCAMSIIGAGISEVVFEEDSYGLADAGLLSENGVVLKRAKRS